jgi:hypothetical protein
VGIGDPSLPKVTRDKTQAIIEEAEGRCTLIQSVHLNTNTPRAGVRKRDPEHLSSVRDDVGGVGARRRRRGGWSRLMDINAGSKGGELNVVQMAACLGQQKWRATCRPCP